jgi:hypothetical protein
VTACASNSTKNLSSFGSSFWNQPSIGTASHQLLPARGKERDDMPAPFVTVLRQRQSGFPALPTVGLDACG